MFKLIKILYLSLILISIPLVCFHYIFKYNSAKGDALAQLAYYASEFGFKDIAKECLLKVELKSHKADINSSIAFVDNLKNSNDTFEIPRRIDYLDQDKFLCRLLTYRILREPLWMSGLLKYKYIDKINYIKNPLKRILPLYALSINDKDNSDSYKDQIFNILLGYEYDKNISDFVYPIAKLAVEYNKPNDFIKFVQLLNTEYKYNLLIFNFFENEENIKIWQQAGENVKKHDYLYAMFRNVRRAVGKRDERLIKGSVIHYPMRYDFNWRKTKHDDFNYPTKAYFAKEFGAEELYQKYLNDSISSQTLKLVLASKHQYLVYAASVFTTLKEYDMAFSLIEYTGDTNLKLEIFNAIVSNLPADKNIFIRAKNVLFNQLL